MSIITTRETATGGRRVWVDHAYRGTMWECFDQERRWEIHREGTDPGITEKFGSEAAAFIALTGPVLPA